VARSLPPRHPPAGLPASGCRGGLRLARCQPPPGPYERLTRRASGAYDRLATVCVMHAGAARRRRVFSSALATATSPGRECHRRASAPPSDPAGRPWQTTRRDPGHARRQPEGRRPGARRVRRRRHCATFVTRRPEASARRPPETLSFDLSLLHGCRGGHVERDGDEAVQDPVSCVRGCVWFFDVPPGLYG